MSLVRKTKSVKLLLNVFKHNKNAISVIDLIDKFVNKMNKTTVYRILDRLESEGILHSFIDQKGHKRYAKELDNNHSNIHPHFVCEDCGISRCIKIDITIPKISKYKIKNAEHILIGTCNECLTN